MKSRSGDFDSRRSLTGRFASAGAVSLIAWIGLGVVSPPPTIPWTQEMVTAAASMRGAIESVSRAASDMGLGPDAALDPNGTGLIGPELGPLFTTLGQLESKRTSTNPDLAALMVHLLHRAGVRPGDTIAVGASGSFPALLVATLAAVRAVGAHPVTILSLGASSYGATRPEMHLLKIHGLLEVAGLAESPPAAASLGGRGDVGGELDASVRERLQEEVRSAGIRLIDESHLRANVERRMALYGIGIASPPGNDLPPDPGSPGVRGAAGPIAAFVNIGGSQPNLGTSPLVLDVPPGLVVELPETELPDTSHRGVLFEMMAQGIPVIHLLHMRGLALRHGLPWDPIPLPAVGTSELRRGERERGGAFWLMTVIYGAALWATATWGRPPHRPQRSTDRSPVRHPDG
jgi:poly-gamma-glutamate system protein